MLKLPRLSVLANKLFYVILSQQTYTFVTANDSAAKLVNVIILDNTHRRVTLTDIFNKNKISWGLRNEIWLLYQPRDNHHCISHSSFSILSFITFLIHQSSQIKDRYGKGRQKAAVSV